MGLNRDDVLKAIDDLRAKVAAMDQPPVQEMVIVSAGMNLPSLIADGAAGRTFALQPGFTIGDFTIAKPCRIVGGMPPGDTRADGAAVTTFHVEGSIAIEAPDVTLYAVNQRGRIKQSTLITCGDRTTLERCVLIGSAQGQHRGIAANAPGVQVRRCYVANIISDQDAQAIAGWDLTHGLVVDDSYLQASGENVLLGGADQASADRMPRSIVIQNSTLEKLPSWQTLVLPGTTKHPQVKNLFEIKAARDVWFRGNELRYTWPGGGQIGFGIVLTVRNQNGKAPWSTIEDVVIEHNLIQHVGGGVQILGREDRGAAFPSGVMLNVQLRNNTFEDIAPSKWGGSGCQVRIAGGPNGLVLENNGFAGERDVNCAIEFIGLDVPTPSLVVRGNTFLEGTYGIKASTKTGTLFGAHVLEKAAPGAVWESNKVIDGPNTQKPTWPNGTEVIV